MRETETVVHAYGQTIALVCGEDATDYPALVFPISLLPYPKKVIEKALLDAASHIQDEGMLKDLKDVAPYLKNFINDDEANRRNEIFKSKKSSAARTGNGPVLASDPAQPPVARQLFSWLQNNPLVERITSLLRRNQH